MSSNEALNAVAAMKHCLETSHAVKKVAMNGVAEAEGDEGMPRPFFGK